MFRSFKILSLCVALSLPAAFGQSLSIRKVATQYSLEASAPAENPGALQATENFHLWIDITNQIAEPFSLLLEGPNISTRFFRLIPAPPEPPPIRLAALGDSLISDNMGWGGGMYGFLKPNATFVNYGYPGETTRSAISHNLGVLSLIKPQYVFFEYGSADVALEVSPEEFEANLRTIVSGIRGLDAIPFLVTYHCHRLFDAKGNFIPNDFPYNPITRRVAAEMNAPLIDLDKMMGELYQRLGPAGSEFMRFIDPRFPNDTIHLSPAGAVCVSQMIIKTLPDGIGPYLTEKIFDPEPSR